jgi:hypothetical protein
MSARLLSPPAPPPPPWSPDNRWLTEWPRRDFLELGALDTAPGSARGHVGNVLAEWAMQDFAEAVRLVVSELTTNAVRATRQLRRDGNPPHTPSVRLWMLGRAGAIVILAWDGVSHVPTPRDAGLDDESGRGLAIVGVLSARWDCYQPPASAGGKVTWALVDHPWRPDLAVA